MRRLNPLVLTCAVIILTCCLHGQYTKADSIKKILEDLVKKRTIKYFNKDKKDQCFKKKKDDVSAENLDSPIKPFGYARVDELNRGITMLSPGRSLSKLNGFRKDIVVGESDFYFVGKGKDLIKFCKCFQVYEVTAKTLGDDGKWNKENGQVKIQLENVQSWTAGNKDPNLFDMIFKMTLDRIIKELDPKAKIKQILGIGRSTDGETQRQFLGPSDKLEIKIDNLKKKFKEWRKWMPEKPEILDGVEKILAAANLTPKQVLEKFLAFVNEKKTEDKPGEWQKKDYVSTDKEIIAVLTSYPKPPNKLRATYNFGKPEVTLKKPKVTMNDVGKAISEFLGVKY